MLISLSHTLTVASNIAAPQILDNVPDKTRDGKVLLLLALDKGAGVMNGTVPLEAVLILVSRGAFG